MERTVLLFDVDGVLVLPAAYHQAIGRTLRHLMHEGGLPDPDPLLPAETDILAAEAAGVHDVWDITCIFYACFLKHQLAAGVLRLEDGRPSRFWPLNCSIAVLDSPVRPPYSEFAAQLAAFPEAPPAEAALNLILRDTPGEAAETLKYRSLFTDLLKNTRSPRRNAVVALFQNIILGSERFSACCGIPAPLSCASLLMSADRSLISPENSAYLLELAARRAAAACIYTARPGLPLPGTMGNSLGFPEAELAAELTALNGLPIVSMGSLEWLADKRGAELERLTKPFMTHAAAALLAALSGCTCAEILEEAFELAFAGLDPASLKQYSDSELKIVVFEDTRSGILPLQELQRKLTALGYRVSLTVLGIAASPQKASALELAGATVFSDVNQAIDWWRKAC